ncbi:unnamed protein product, partial [Didymodactylos carnosus]
MSFLVALIIGNSDELEDEIAYQLGRKGVCVLFCSSNETNLERVTKRLNDEEIQANFILLDAIDHKTIDKITELIDKQFGKLDILVNVGILFNNDQFKINIMTPHGFEAKEFFDTLAITQAFKP